MVLVALPLALLLAAPVKPSTVTVLVSRRTGVSAERGRHLAAQVTSALSAAKVKVALPPDAALRKLAAVGVKDSAICEGKRACLAEMGRQLAVDVVVGVAASEVQGELSVYVEALKSGDGTPLAKDGFIVPASAAKDLSESLAPFVEALRTSLPRVEAKPAPVARAPDAPLVQAPPKLGPEPKPEGPELVEPGPSRAPAYLTTGAAAAALATAAYFTATALSERGQLQRHEVELGDGRYGSPLTGSEAIALSNRANADFAIGAAAGAAGLALGTIALIMWVED